MQKYKNKTEGKFRSKLEQFCAKELTANNIDYTYEEWKVDLQPKFVFPYLCYEKTKHGYLSPSENIRSITYTPDFVGDWWVIETKGQETTDFIIKWKMFKHYLVENKLDYMLFKPTNQKQIKESIKIIKDVTTSGIRNSKSENKRSSTINK